MKRARRYHSTFGLLLLGLSLSLPSVLFAEEGTPRANDGGEPSSPPEAASPTDADRRLRSLEKRLASVRQSEDAAVAKDAIEHAQKALTRATEQRSSDSEAADRAIAIADAALLLAERQVALVAERRALSAARARVKNASALLAPQPPDGRGSP